MRLRPSVFSGLLVLALASLAPAANAGSSMTVGPHFGFSTDPGQVVLGGQLTMADVAPQLDFVPSVDLGFGDGVTVVAFNGDFHYRIRLQDATWQPYAGAGVSLYTASAGGFGGSATVGGGSLIVGADVPTKNGSRFFVEGKICLGDGPGFKALAGWNFRTK